MLSRRQLLAAAGAGAGVGALGVGVDRTIHRGTVFEKWIRGWDGEGPELVHSVVIDSSGTPYVPETDEELFDTASGRRPVATDEVHAHLGDRYDRVEYGLNVCVADVRRDCRGGTASREAFNAVQVTDEVTAAVAADRVRLLRP